MHAHDVKVFLRVLGISSHMLLYILVLISYSPRIVTWNTSDQSELKLNRTLFYTTPSFATTCQIIFRLYCLFILLYLYKLLPIQCCYLKKNRTYWNSDMFFLVSRPVYKMRILQIRNCKRQTHFRTLADSKKYNRTVVLTLNQTYM